MIDDLGFERRGKNIESAIRRAKSAWHQTNGTAPDGYQRARGSPLIPWCARRPTTTRLSWRFCFRTVGPRDQFQVAIPAAVTGKTDVQDETV
jgi:hypothetical protein